MHTDDYAFQTLEKLRDIHSTQKRFGIFFVLFHLVVVLPVFLMAGLLLFSLFWGMSQAPVLSGPGLDQAQQEQILRGIESNQKGAEEVQKAAQRMVDQLGLPGPRNFKK